MPPIPCLTLEMPVKMLIEFCASTSIIHCADIAADPTSDGGLQTHKRKGALVGYWTASTVYDTDFRVPRGDFTRVLELTFDPGDG